MPRRTNGSDSSWRENDSQVKEPRASSTPPNVVIVDYRLGNLFSVKNACSRFGINARISYSKDHLWAADLAILPGVGAFGNAMRALHELDLVVPLKDFASSGKPLVGICLGMQLLMTESHEFGRHDGLDIISGSVERLPTENEGGRQLKIPHIGWEAIRPPVTSDSGRCWDDSPLRGLRDGTFMYFVHSYVVKPADSNLTLALSQYGSQEFCSSLGTGNIFATQFHPERSGSDGLTIYRNIVKLATRTVD